jgi:hypothetical protein
MENGKEEQRTRELTRDEEWRMGRKNRERESSPEVLTSGAADRTQMSMRTKAVPAQTYFDGGNLMAVLSA